MPPSPGNPNTPVPLIKITADDIRGDPESFAALLNQEFQNLVQSINALTGVGGTINLNSHLNMGGKKITNVAAPSKDNDVITMAAANKAYSAPALAPQIEATGPYPLSTYRQLNNPNQRELSSSFLNFLGNTAPNTNSSNVSFGLPSGGFTPTTVSSGVLVRADGSILPYAQLNDSVAQPATFAISTISRTGNIVTGFTTGVNTLTTGDSVQVAGVLDPSFDGGFVLTFVGNVGSPPSPGFQYAQAGADAASTGGTISLFGIYYYVIDPAVGKMFRIGPFAADTAQNRINATSDGSTLVAVATITGAGGSTINSGGGATSPVQNTGRIIVPT